MLAARVRLVAQRAHAELVQRDWRAPVRPWRHFAARLRAPPRSSEALRDRVLLNSHVFQTNYALLALGAVLLVALRRPAVALLLPVVAALAALAASPRPLLLRGVRVTASQRYAFCAAAAALLLLASGLLRPLLLALAVAAALILAHAACRSTNMRHKLVDIRTRISDSW